ncbi:uncharacterized [Tachysurus ichikawai]
MDSTLSLESSSHRRLKTLTFTYSTRASTFFTALLCSAPFMPPAQTGSILHPSRFLTVHLVSASPLIT